MAGVRVVGELTLLLREVSAGVPSIPGRPPHDVAMSSTIELPDLGVLQPTSPSPPPSTHHTFGEDKGAGRDARWVRPALIALLVITAFAYLWDLSASGYANSFYAAAVQAGTKSWKAFFFGSIDSSNFITVDKPPASLWVMELSGRIFGFSSWSMLAPQALAGVASVGILYATVKRWFGAPAGLLAGAVLALTPVAALMFRYNNPDALLVLLLVASAYTLTRALEKAGTRWLVATGALLGFAFLAKMMQAFTVVPAFYFVYLLAAPTSLARRIKQLVVCTGALAVAAGWWVMTVALWPVGSRPMIDGSPDNSIWNLIFDYNGFGRLVSSGAGGSGGGFSGATGVFRLFNDLMGGQASWLLPAALLALVTGLVVRFGAPRTDRTRAAVLLWGGWLVVTGAVFSFGQGVIHTYYTVALAPAVAALVAIGAVQLWQYRQHMQARVIGALGIVGTAAWSYELLSRSPSYVPWLRIVVLAAGVLSAVALVLAPLATRYDRHLTRAWVGLGLIACLAGPAAFVGTTVTTAYTGSVPSAGPAVTSAVTGGGPQGGGGGGAPSGANGTTRRALPRAQVRRPVVPPRARRLRERRGNPSERDQRDPSDARAQVRPHPPPAPRAERRPPEVRPPEEIRGAGRWPQHLQRTRPHAGEGCWLVSLGRRHLRLPERRQPRARHQW